MSIHLLLSIVLYWHSCWQTTPPSAFDVLSSFHCSYFYSDGYLLLLFVYTSFFAFTVENFFLEKKIAVKTIYFPLSFQYSYPLVFCLRTAQSQKTYRSLNFFHHWPLTIDLMINRFLLLIISINIFFAVLFGT